ncbi:hypothetical protein, partial [Cellulomonas endophytica]|uniref:hypothetical protein n=1 Tax=Cellulomonas endophytica TaxID=2494735 RepID=UPI0013E94F70
TAGEDRSARLWDTTTGTEQGRAEHSGAVRAVAFSRDGALLGTAGADRSVVLWAARSDRRAGPRSR